MEWLVVTCVVVLLLLAFRKPNKESFFGGALPAGRCRQPVLDFPSRLALAPDTDIPVRLGQLRSQPFKFGEMQEAMSCAVALANKRCGLDLTMLAFDGATKCVDAVKNEQLTADVHVYSELYNCSLTLKTTAVRGNTGQRYLRSIKPASEVGPDVSGVEAAPADIFRQKFGTYENFV